VRACANLQQSQAFAFWHPFCKDNLSQNVYFSTANCIYMLRLTDRWNDKCICNLRTTREICKIRGKEEYV